MNMQALGNAIDKLKAHLLMLDSNLNTVDASAIQNIKKDKNNFTSHEFLTHIWLLAQVLTDASKNAKTFLEITKKLKKNISDITVILTNIEDITNIPAVYDMAPFRNIIRSGAVFFKEFVDSMGPAERFLYNRSGFSELYETMTTHLEKYDPHDIPIDPKITALLNIVNSDTAKDALQQTNLNLFTLEKIKKEEEKKANSMISMMSFSSSKKRHHDNVKLCDEIITQMNQEMIVKYKNIAFDIIHFHKFDLEWKALLLEIKQKLPIIQDTPDKAELVKLIAQCEKLFAENDEKTSTALFKSSDVTTLQRLSTGFDEHDYETETESIEGTDTTDESTDKGTESTERTESPDESTDCTDESTDSTDESTDSTDESTESTEHSGPH